MTNNRGSEWRKWDFHVHTKGTNKNDQFSSQDLDDFFYNFFKEAINNNIQAIGITDYFTIDRYLDTVKYVSELKTAKNRFTIEEIRFIKNIFLFPNVELRLLPSTDKSRLINIHCIFNPEYVEKLEHDFFTHIENQDNYKMNRDGFIQYGKSLDSNITNDLQALKKGIDNFVVDPRALQELVKSNKNFKNNTLIVVSNSNNDGASGLQKHYDLFENESGSLDGVRKTIYHISGAIFSNNPKDIKYFLGKRLEETEGYNKEIHNKEVLDVIKKTGSLKPCITGCDAHKEDDLFKKFTWIKSDLSFEGLKQIIYEPEQRVKTQEDKPDFKEGKYIINEALFNSDENLFNNQPIKLNKNLNVIIGGKSSGKSILLYNIAKTLLPDQSFFEREGIDYDFRKNDESFNFKIKTLGGFEQEQYRTVPEENSLIPEIKYIPQNYLIKLADPKLHKKGNELNKIVRDLINENNDAKLVYEQFITNVKNNDKIRDRLIDDYFEIKEKINILKNNLNLKTNKEVLEKNIKTNNEQINKLNKNIGLTEEEIKKYNALKNNLDKINLSLEKIKYEYNDFKTFYKKINEIVNGIKILQELSPDYETQEIKDLSIHKFEKINIFIEELQKEINSYDDNDFIDDKVKALLIQKEEEKQKIEKEIEPFLKEEKVKQIIQELEESIKKDNLALNDIIQLTEELRLNKEKLINKKEEIFQSYILNISEYDKIINSLEVRTVELKEDNLNITGLKKFNFPKFRNRLIEISDLRRIPSSHFPYLYDPYKKIVSDPEITNIINELKILFDFIVEDDYPLKRVDKNYALKKVVLYDYFYDFWEIEYLGDYLGNELKVKKMSTGKASFVILMLIIGLSKSKSPILIDQPEDNLDNRSISSDLVEYLKNKKLERQIILVTHNPNVVVNADAENIIVAEQERKEIGDSSIFQFTYTNGSIENPIIKKHVAEIVEGGKEAFQKREKKYGFK